MNQKAFRELILKKEEATVAKTGRNDSRVESKRAPKGVSLESLLKPRVVVEKEESRKERRKNVVELKTQMAEDYVNRLHGSIDPGSISTFAMSILKLALKETKPVLAETRIRETTYRFDVGFDSTSQIYIGSSDSPNPFFSAIHQDNRQIGIDASERQIIIELLKTLEVVQPIFKRNDVLVAPQSGEDDEDDEDIFADAGTDYVLEVRNGANPKTFNPSIDLFNEVEDAENAGGLEGKLEIGLLNSTPALQSLIQNSHMIAHKDMESNDDESISSLDQMPDQDVDYDYDFDDSDEDDVVENLKTTIKNDFQQVDRIYQAKYGTKRKSESNPTVSRKK